MSILTYARSFGLISIESQEPRGISLELVSTRYCVKSSSVSVEEIVAFFLPLT